MLLPDDLIINRNCSKEMINLHKKTLEKPKKANENFNIFIAYYLNKVRLIDNI